MSCARPRYCSRLAQWRRLAMKGERCNSERQLRRFARGPFKLEGGAAASPDSCPAKVFIRSRVRERASKQAFRNEVLSRENEAVVTSQRAELSSAFSLVGSSLKLNGGNQWELGNAIPTLRLQSRQYLEYSWRVHSISSKPVGNVPKVK